MSIYFEYVEERWDNLAKIGHAGKVNGRTWEACVVCGRRTWTDKPYFQLEINWKDNRAFDPETDPPTDSQGCFPIGPGCIKNNPQLKRLVAKVEAN